jgi:hypothetical protein
MCARGGLCIAGVACLYRRRQESGWMGDGRLAGLNVFGNTVFAYMVFAMLAKVCLLFSSWNAWYTNCHFHMVLVH